MQNEKNPVGDLSRSAALRKRAFEWARRAWRPAGTVVAVALAGLIMWHVVNGKHGLSVWQQKRAEDHQLQREIKDLEQDNSLLRDRVSRLKTDPYAIEHEAREKMHYAKPGEVIYTLPEKPQAPPVAAAK